MMIRISYVVLEHGWNCSCRFFRRASLTADQVPKLLHLTEPDQERQPGDESADTPDQAAAIADGLEQLALGGDSSTDSPDAAAKSGKESTQQLPRQQEGAFQGLAPDLDFAEFLQRQKAFVEVCHFLSAIGIGAQYMS